MPKILLNVYVYAKFVNECALRLSECRLVINVLLQY